MTGDILVSDVGVKSKKNRNHSGGVGVRGEVLFGSWRGHFPRTGNPMRGLTGHLRDI